MARGQIFSQDLVISSMIMIVLISQVVLVSNTLASRVQGSRDYGIMEEVSAGILEQLSSTGDPANWQASGIENAHSIGLCERQGVLDEAKVAAFFSLAQDAEWRARAGAIMAVSRESAAQDFAVEILDEAGTLIYSAGTPPANETVVVKSAWRMLGGSPVLLKVKVWEMNGNIPNPPDYDADYCQNGQCTCDAGWICTDSTHRAYRSLDCSLSQLTNCQAGCENGECEVILQCTPGWICADATHRAYRSQDCTLSGLAECPDGCENGECEVILQCTPGWICTDATHLAYRNQDCAISQLTECPEGCFDGECEISPPRPPRCTPGWICTDVTHKAYRSQDCSLSQLTLCPDGCVNGVCQSTPKEPKTPEQPATGDVT